MNEFKTTETYAISIIASMCIRMFGLLIIIAECCVPAGYKTYWNFIGKQRMWMKEQRDMLEVASMVDEAMGDDGFIPLGKRRET